MAAPGPTSAPFLSVIVRTQGRRLIPLEDNLTSLAAQTNRDIEVIVCCHDTADSDYAAVVEVMDRLPRWFGERTRAIRVEGGGRAHPLEVGVAQASGRYVAFLDDDDLALCHWVEEFAKLAKLHPGAVVRAGCATHSIDEELWECGTGYSQIGPTTTPYPLEFDLVAAPGRQPDPQLLGGRSPKLFHGPRRVLRRRAAGAGGLGDVAERRAAVRRGQHARGDLALQEMEAGLRLAHRAPRRDLGAHDVVHQRAGSTRGPCSSRPER